MTSTRGVRGAMAVLAGLTLAASATPALAAVSAAESTPSPASPRAAGWSESKVTPGNAALYASTRPDAKTTWVAGMRIVQEGDDAVFVPALWERDERKGPGWKRVKTAPVTAAPHEDVRFNDVDASSPRNGMLVGDYVEQVGGVVTQRWNGTAWKSAVAPVPRGTVSAGFTSVDTRAPNDAWAAGWTQVRGEDGSRVAGTLQHWDGTRWKAQKLPDVVGGDKDQPWMLSSVTALAADDVWAVGRTGFFTPEKPVLLHYDGTRWSKVAVSGVPAHAGLNEVAAGPGGQLWAVGGSEASDSSMHALALRYDGRKWTNVPLPRGTGELNSVAISQGDPVVLERKTEETSAVFRYSGGRWVSMKLPADGAKPYAASDISVSGRTIDVVGERPETGTQVVGPGSVLTARR